MHCWCLKDKEGNLVDPVALDAHICAALGVDPDPHYYIQNWWDVIGCALIAGKTIQQINEEAKTSFFATRRDRVMWEILSEYNGEAWYQSRSYS